MPDFLSAEGQAILSDINILKIFVNFGFSGTALAFL